ncbi:Immunoglobulin [Trinorchestia longiramus]|nr:Immunoglobulin [Trinorchestia longiramus]
MYPPLGTLGPYGSNWFPEEYKNNHRNTDRSSTGTPGVEILSIEMPPLVRVGDTINLTCHFRLLGEGQKIYTVNWWRDKDQFYTYNTEKHNNKSVYHFEGIHVDDWHSNLRSVVLLNVSRATSGTFKCEVMTEAPAFKTAVMYKNLTVIGKGNEQRTRHEQAKKRAAPVTQRHYLTSRLKHPSLALQETRVKPQNYRQPEYISTESLSKNVLLHHQMNTADLNPSQDESQTSENNRNQGNDKNEPSRAPDYQNDRGTGVHTKVDDTNRNLIQLKILVGNEQSLLPQMHEIQAIVSTLSHIIAVNGTWLDLNRRHLPAEVALRGYAFNNVDKPSRSNRRGGSLSYIKEKLQLQIKAKRVTEKTEILHLTIQPHPRQVIKIVLVNRNPTSTSIDNDEYYEYFDNILSALHAILIMRDVNLLYVNWITHQNRAPGSNLIGLINTNSLQQHVNEPNRRNNILDLLMTISDHRIIGLEITDKIGTRSALEVHDPNTRTRQKRVFDYRGANFELVKEELSSINYKVLMRNKYDEECYMTPKEKIATAREHHIPTKQREPITVFGLEDAEQL